MVKAVFSNQRSARYAAVRVAALCAAVVTVPLVLGRVLWGMSERFGVEIYLLGGALVLCAAVLGAVWSGRFVRWRIVAGFDLICEHAPDPYFLTEADCTLITSNPAARRWGAGECVTGAAASSRLLADELRRWTSDADQIVYRLSRRATQTWGEPESTGGAAPRYVTVRHVGAGILMWRIETPRSLAKLSAEEATFPIAEFSAEGRLKKGNAAFLALTEEMQVAIISAARRALGAGNASAVLEGEDGGAVVLGVAATRGGEASVFALDRRAGRDETLSQLLEHLPVALARMDADGAIMSINASARKLLGPRASVGAPLETLVEGFGRPIGAQVREAAAGRGAGRTEQARGLVEGRDVFLQINLTRAPDDERGELIAVLSDATELKTLEQQFVQSQKMQAVGQMAGGVAHDFNNLLTAIIGHCDLLMLRTDQAQPAFADLTQIKQNANRAAALVRQLLAFSRKQTLKPKLASLSDTLNELSHLLNRLLGERVRIELDHAFDLWPVWIDERQFEQVIVNLAVNARDAMPDGGSVSVRCWNRTLTETWRRDRAVVPAGEYVCIKVADTGAGMDRDTMNKVFEPFFTTKRQGEGTGLGLSTAYGIVKQMDGFIFVDSTPGTGSVFTILLPRMRQAPVSPAAEEEAHVAEQSKSRGDLTGSGAILLVEDEAPVRAFAARALKLRGYDVIEADCAEAALTILEDRDVAIDLMISDVVMPGMDGPSWVRTARETRPNVGVIFISGYAEGVFRNGMEDIDNYTFLAKPFVLDELAAAVKAALGAKDTAE